MAAPGAIRIRPPFLAALCLLGALAIDTLLPTGPLVPSPYCWIGWVPVGAGVALVAWALGLFRRRGTPPDPNETPAVLVVSGPYRFTRNPMYLGVTLVLLGIGLLLGTWPYLLAPLAFGTVISLTRIPAEERQMEALFGEAYRHYRRRVRRWL